MATYDQARTNKSNVNRATDYFGLGAGLQYSPAYQMLMSDPELKRIFAAYAGLGAGIAGAYMRRGDGASMLPYNGKPAVGYGANAPGKDAYGAGAHQSCPRCGFDLSPITDPVGGSIDDVVKPYKAQTGPKYTNKN